MPLLYDENEVNEFEDANRVQDKESNEPPLFSPAGCVPERIALEDDDNEEYKGADDAKSDNCGGSKSPTLSIE